MRIQTANKIVKIATNITLSQEVIDDAKALGLNLSKTCEQILREAIRIEKERRWADDYADFIAAYNHSVQEDGLAREEWRSF